jgi:hypothetical protein
LEVIKLYAQSVPFPEVDIITQDGLDYLSGSLEEVSKKTRSMQIEEAKTADQYYYGESALMVTTLEK